MYRLSLWQPQMKTSQHMMISPVPRQLKHLHTHALSQPPLLTPSKCNPRHQLPQFLPKQLEREQYFMKLRQQFSRSLQGFKHKSNLMVCLTRFRESSWSFLLCLEGGHSCIIRSAQADKKKREAIHDPPVLNPKGRPRSQRMTGAAEGRCHEPSP